ncbi:M48 family metalloprotease [Schlegelella sp. ID0723]|uniref:M48 family metalloprotease n=1 Tax=Piscinibacter koreensis TaxID=2742824 RepID=A0A7Y6NK84_9BURK|nr:M48 family metallopeptidase [Schlegelella koreensis]NUZ04680.1 M48 family metalloprotease [Schlegelella koreensis]
MLRLVALCLLSLFLVPAGTLWFARYASAEFDAAIVQAIEERIDGDPRASPEQKAAARAYYRSHPPSVACNDADPEAQDYREAVCARYSRAWQFGVAERVAYWTLVGGAALLAAALALGALAFASRGLRYASFVAGWRLMTLASAVEVAAQSAMCVWLSFWVTAVFFQSYFVKLIIIAGLFAAAAVFFAVYTLFRKYPGEHAVEGELLGEADAPRLWARVRELAGRLGTAPPDHIVAGIDANFFVTEAPVTLGERRLTGRTLYLSIPLLRVLDSTEAEAVLAHELAHLQGGDARSSAALGPMLIRYDIYTAQMRQAGLSIVAHYLLRLYRVIFQFALSRDSRERELRADRSAAAVATPSAIAQSLVKIAAYANYRSNVEGRLFAHDQRHTGELGIAGFVASGLLPYAASGEFLDAMKTANVPHPFDSHPPLGERMRNVGSPIDEAAYGEVVSRLPQSSWADEIVDAAAIEQRLWQAYEERFSQSHERALAYRYEPANDDERAIVLKYFPPLSFALAKGAIEISHAGIRTDAEFIRWDSVKALAFASGNLGGDRLVVTHPEKGLVTWRRTTIKLRGLGKQSDAFRAVVGQYWQRHQIMRAQQAAAAAADAHRSGAPA